MPRVTRREQPAKMGSAAMEWSHFAEPLCLYHTFLFSPNTNLKLTINLISYFIFYIPLFFAEIQSNVVDYPTCIAFSGGCLSAGYREFIKYYPIEIITTILTRLMLLRWTFDPIFTFVLDRKCRLLLITGLTKMLPIKQLKYYKRKVPSGTMTRSTVNTVK